MTRLRHLKPKSDITGDRDRGKARAPVEPCAPRTGTGRAFGL